MPIEPKQADLQAKQDTLRRRGALETEKNKHPEDPRNYVRALRTNQLSVVAHRTRGNAENSQISLCRK